MGKSVWSVRAFGRYYIFRALPSRTFTATKVFRNEHGTYFIVNGKGQVFCSMVQGGYSAMSSKHRRALTLLDGLVALGMLTGDSVSKLRAEQEKDKQRQTAGYAAAEILNNATDAGIALSAKQTRYLKRLVKQG